MCPPGLPQTRGGLWRRALDVYVSENKAALQKACLDKTGGVKPKNVGLQWGRLGLHIFQSLRLFDRWPAVCEKKAIEAAGGMSDNFDRYASSTNLEKLIAHMRMDVAMPCEQTSMSPLIRTCSKPATGMLYIHWNIEKSFIFVTKGRWTGILWFGLRLAVNSG